MEGFFEWLRKHKKLDLYEALLDISTDFSVEQGERLDAGKKLDELLKEYLGD